MSTTEGTKSVSLALVTMLCGFYTFASDTTTYKNNVPLLQRNIQKVVAQVAPHVSLSSRVQFYGVANVIAIYRHMNNYYPDIEGKDRNLSFAPYASNGVINSNTNQPALQLFMDVSPTPQTFVRVGYSFFHSYSGNGSRSRSANVPGMLQFESSIKSRYGTFKLIAGGGSNNFNMSPLTMSNKTNREPLYEKMPWDWYRNAFQKYSDRYQLSSLSIPGNLDYTATQGVILEATDLPWRTGLKIFYGKSNLTSTYDRALAGYPLNIIATRFVKYINSHALGINYYNQFGYANRSASMRDNRSIATVDCKMKFPKWSIYTENGIALLDNPAMPQRTGYAFTAELLLSQQLTCFPVSLKFYAIDRYVVSLESAVLNSNTSTPQGGYGATPYYDNTTFRNMLQQTGVMANNRAGGIVSTEKAWGRFKINLALSASIEKQNVDSVITFEHRDNGYSRSRFSPWVQYFGPYGNIGNRFRQSIETLVVTENRNIHRKGFTTADVGFNYKTKFLRKELILMNFISYGSIRQGFSCIPKYSQNVLLNTAYEEFSVYWKVHSKLTVSSFALFQKNRGGHGTTRSPGNAKSIDQFGSGCGIGLDFDFDDNSGLFFRHRWMHHQDNNFTQDKFSGTETSIEFKLFF